MASALLLTACAFGPGTGFATVSGSTVAVELPLPAARLDAASRWKTSNGYLLTLAEPGVALTLQSVALQAPGAATAAGSGATFDPANPPPRYSLCHGGHCHRDDGALIDYADIQAELSAGGAPAASIRVLSATATEPTATLGPNRAGAWQLAGCSPDCFLDRGTVNGTAIALDRLKGEGTVEAGAGLPALPQGPRRFTFDLALQGQAFSAPVSASIERSQPGTFRLGGTLTLTDKLFDGIEWDRLAAGNGALDLTADAKTRETLLANLAKSAWKAELTPQRLLHSQGDPR